jgi:diguanylate cyclase (GGDEF)-like protein
MAVNSTTSFSRTGDGLFSPEEVRHLMRLEFERARRYEYSTACMLISVDRLGALQDIYGVETKNEILQAVVDLLETQTRASDYLGCKIDERILAVYPHTSAKAATALAQRLLKGARQISFEGDGRTLRITLSIGIAHNEDRKEVEFETLLGVAEDGLKVAESAGGDRSVETELYQLYEAKRRREESEQSHKPMDVFGEETQFLNRKILEIQKAFEAEKRGREADRAKLDEVLASTKGFVAQRNAEKERTYQNEIQLLERRIHKLTDQLGLTEKELQRVLKMKTVDEGIASLYGGVQGLAGDDANYETKKELMSQIFAANLELKRKIAGG